MSISILCEKETCTVRKKTSHCQTTLSVGATVPFTVLHLSDNHLALADARDNDRKRRLAESRSQHFSSETGLAPEETLDRQLSYAREKNYTVLHTGDVCDFVSVANLERAQQAFAGVDYFMAAGNHEFSRYVGEAFEDERYRLGTYDYVQRYFRNDLTFAAREISGVNFVACNNGYYRFTWDQLDAVRKEAEKGLPIVLMVHNQIYTDDMHNDFMRRPGRKCGYLCGTPICQMDGYSPMRMRQQLPDESTMAFIRWVTESGVVKAVLAGHLHEPMENMLPGGIPQLIAGGGYMGCMREIFFQ